MSTSAPAATSPLDAIKDKPTAAIVIGMAGSGKTTLMSALTAHLAASATAPPPYVINLDPAVTSIPYGANIDIRDTVDYASVMSTYNLGPNGGILTSLNLFATKFDQVLDILSQRSAAGAIGTVLVDTPGQIEIFTWSASGHIITSALATAHPTVILYVLDTPASVTPQTFMSNMLYACSVLYKTQLPMVLVCTKTDVKGCDFVEDWMHDFEAFQAAIQREQESLGGADGGSYSLSLISSMSLALEEFYKTLRTCGVSSVTGDGLDELVAAMTEARQEYVQDVLPRLERERSERDAVGDAKRREQIERLMRDMKVDDGQEAGVAAGELHEKNV